MAGWERFRKSSIGRDTEPRVRIGKGGTLSINGLALELLGGTDHVQLLFDRAARSMGIKACTADALDSYTLNKTKGTSATVNVRAYLRYFKIEDVAGTSIRPGVEPSQKTLVCKLPEAPPGPAPTMEVPGAVEGRAIRGSADGQLMHANERGN